MDWRGHLDGLKKACLYPFQKIVVNLRTITPPAKKIFHSATSSTTFRLLTTHYYLLTKTMLRHDPDGHTRVYDPLRRNWFILTPEEAVRQRFVHMLVNSLGYSPVAMANEVGIRLNGTLKRCDTVAYNRAGAVSMVIEYKAPTIPITRRVLDQVARYNLTLGARFIVVHNGNTTHCARLNPDRTYSFLSALPSWEEVSAPVP